MQARDRRKFGGLTLTDLRSPHSLDPETRGRLKEITRDLRGRYQKEAPLSIKDQEDAGLIADPVYAIARYAAQMAHDNHTADFFNFVASNKDWTAAAGTPGFVEIPDNPRFGRLAGTWVMKEIADDVLQLVESPNIALQVYDTLLRAWKTGKTVLNPGTHVRNILGNLYFAQFAGTSPWNPGNTRYYAQAIGALKNGGASLTEMYENGVLGADFVRAELRQVLRGLLPDAATVEGDTTAMARIGMAIGKVIPQWAKRPVSGSFNVITALYQVEDELFKAAAYLKAKDMGMSAAEAAQHVRKWFPYYDGGNSPTLRAVQRTALPFLSFYRESIRIFGTALKERPLALAAGLAVPSTITFLSALLMGLSDRDRDEITKDMRGKGGKLLGPFLADWPVFSMLLPFRTADGQLQQLDLSAVHPFADHLGQKLDMSRDGRPWWQMTIQAMIAAGPVGSLLYSGATGKDTFGDRNVWEADMSGTEKAAAYAEHAWTVLAPPLAPGGTGWQTLANAGSRTTNKTFEKRDTTQAALRALGGIDVRNANPNLYRMADDFRRQKGLPVDEQTRFGTMATSRARSKLFAALAQDTPDQTEIVRQLAFLRAEGVPIDTLQDINRLLFYRDPIKVIGGDKKREIPADVMQQQFRAGLTGEARRVLEQALAEFRQIQARAPMAIQRARAALPPPTMMP